LPENIEKCQCQGGGVEEEDFACSSEEEIEEAKIFLALLSPTSVHIQALHF